jgi:hypothetical protein
MQYELSLIQVEGLYEENHITFRFSLNTKNEPRCMGDLVGASGYRTGVQGEQVPVIIRQGSLGSTVEISDASGRVSIEPHLLAFTQELRPGLVLQMNLVSRGYSPLKFRVAFFGKI